jgi:hypothetical protein
MMDIILQIFGWFLFIGGIAALLFALFADRLLAWARRNFQ